MEKGNGDIDTGEEYIVLDSSSSEFRMASKGEIEKAKEDGTVCITASQTWYSIGEDRCVVFTPEAVVYDEDGGFVFYNERRDYSNGFVVVDMSKGEDSIKRAAPSLYSGYVTTVRGTTERYEGHPEIKIYNPSRQHTAAMLYAYSTRYESLYTYLDVCKRIYNYCNGEAEKRVTEMMEGALN